MAKITLANQPHKREDKLHHFSRCDYIAKIHTETSLFILWVAFCCSTNTLAQTATPTTIHTPNGSVVPDTYIVQEMSQAQIAALNNSVAQNYPLATRLADASYTYNCHGYAWYMSQGGATVWIGYNTPGSQSIFWTDNSYTSVASCQTVGERVRYSNDDHSAITTGTPDIFISKWQSMPLMQHHKDYCPYNSTGLYYVGTPKVLGNSTLCTNGTYTLQSPPPGATVTWSSSNQSGLAVNPSSGAATRVNNFSGQVTVTSAITASQNVCFTVPQTFTKTVRVGPYTHSDYSIIETITNGVHQYGLGSWMIVDATATYNWSWKNYNYASGQGTRVVTLNPIGTSGGYVGLSVGNACGWSDPNPQQFFPYKASFSMMATPIPASSALTVQVIDSTSDNSSAQLQQSYRVTLYNRMSQTV